ncbi:MAG: TerD family protein, partial [Oscillospiraceae bacterium]|nr:TerD family protein [Oscillospiraceae bacterium]
MAVQDKADIQKLLDTPDSSGVVHIPAGEYEGKFIVTNSCTINGNGAVLWNSSGPVLVVAAENVTVNNIKIELTSDNIPYEQMVSVYCKYSDTKFSDTEINGMLLGIPDEEQYWGFPRVISLGRIPAEREQSFALELYTPVEAEISGELYNVSLSADTLSAGFNTVTLTVGKVRSGSLLYGCIRIRSAVERKIIISGEIGDENEPMSASYMLCSVQRDAPIRHSEMLERLDPVRLATLPEPEQEAVESTYEPIDEPVTYSGESGGREENVLIPSGKRIPLSMKQYKFELLWKSARTAIDMDGYLFMLNGSGTVSSDKRMIFFGNDRSDCGSVHYLNAADKRAMFVDFGRVPRDVTRIVLLFSIYGNKPDQLFSMLDEAEVSVLCENGVHMHMPLENGIQYRTILALGFEKTDGVWEMISSGKGVAMSLADICRSYGVT